jgi:hypothetical protein
MTALRRIVVDTSQSIPSGVESWQRKREIADRMCRFALAGHLL